jgi:hypothetical protein
MATHYEWRDGWLYERGEAWKADVATVIEHLLRRVDDLEKIIEKQQPHVVLDPSDPTAIADCEGF